VHAFVRRLHDKELPDGSISVSYSFAHVLYQHAIEETLTPSRRANLSRALPRHCWSATRATPSPWHLAWLCCLKRRATSSRPRITSLPPPPTPQDYTRTGSGTLVPAGRG
jgi:hypothetical protein